MIPVRSTGAPECRGTCGPLGLAQNDPREAQTRDLGGPSPRPAATIPRGDRPSEKKSEHGAEEGKKRSFGKVQERRGPREGRSWSARHVPHISYQQISILTLNFNTSFVGHLTNVATLEYFTLTVFFFVFVERCSRVWLGCIERYTWLAVLTKTHVFLGHGMFFFWIPPKLSCPWYRWCLVDSGGNLLNMWL